MTDIRVAIAYHTGFGKTGSLARAVAIGAASVQGAAVDLVEVSGATRGHEVT